MSKRTSPRTYLKLGHRTMESISMTKKTDVGAFKRLEKKAKKYLAKAKGEYVKPQKNKKAA